MSPDAPDRYESLADWAESDDAVIRPGQTIERGSAEGRARVRAMLYEATEDDPAGRALVEKVARMGRPTLDPDAPRGPSPQWQVRAPQSLDTAMRARARAEGRSLSDVVRSAATQHLAREAS
ncbi:MAG: hypothetical protein FWD74_05115 [Actinomycetia bacterium]|nr:hypothetical protein [Actinomycetes bacterium]